MRRNIFSNTSTYTKCVIYADSKAAIQGIDKLNKQSGQAILISAITKIQSLVQQRRMSTEIKWVPRHEGVRGNEEADEAAKEAANSKGNEPDIARCIHKPLKSARSVCIKRETMDDWNAAWQSQNPDHDAKQLRLITKKPNALRGTKLYQAIILTRRQTAQLTQLRTGHRSLNQYLHRFGHVDSLRCDCGNGANENVEHFLLHCSRYDRQHAKLAREVGVCGMRMERLLGRPRMI